MRKRVFCAVLFPVLLLTAVVLLSCCSASKFVPDGRYMLDDVRVTTDNDTLSASQLEPYIRQKANSKWFSVLKVPLGAYSLSGKDSTKWINRTLRNLGEQPVIYDSAQAMNTCTDLVSVMRGMGYMHASADFRLDMLKRRKVRVVYNAHPGRRFHINSIRYDIHDKAIAGLLSRDSSRWAVLRPGMPLVAGELDAERKRIAALLNDNGYFKFHKDFIAYTADTVSGSTAVDLTMVLVRYRASSDAEETDHKCYKIRQIKYHGIGADSIIPIRKPILEENTIMEENRNFNASELQKTYNRFSRLQIVKYTNIKFTELPDSGMLDCDISISTNKANSISFQPEGTNTAGDLGAAVSLTYENRNLFRGAETFSVKLRGAFEAITGLEGYQNQDYEEYSVEGRLMFPRFLVPFLSRNFKKRSNAVSELTVSYNLQNRPEFHRRVFSGGWRYRWNDASGRRTYKIDVLDLNYIYMPWISAKFKHDYLDDVDSRNSILRYNYEDLFIAKLGFGLSYTGGKEAFKINVESSGNLLNGFSRLIGGNANGNGQYTLFNIAFAQYVKGDFDYTRLLRFDNRNSLALHFGFGVAYPYGNSKVLPFEKRYFSGGANSVRGWSVRGLGPGKFKGTDGSIDFINQTGDLKLDMNAELRTFLFWKFYGALFIDAGNIWTLRYYDEQPGGQFHFRDFYKQIAVAYGLGLRLNFDYFILRFDMGMKAVNPAYTSNEEHYAVFHPDLSRDFAFHFAVGLPF